MPRSAHKENPQGATLLKGLGRIAMWAGMSLLSSWGWLLTIVAFILGYGLFDFLGWSPPAWVGWMALLALPAGAWLENRLL